MSNSQTREDDVHISKGSAVEGKIMSSGTVTVAGKVTGEITCQVLIVQQGGVVNGIIASKEARIAGTVGEDIKVENTLHIDATGIVGGKCSYGTLEILKGGQLNGQVLHTEKKPAAKTDENGSAEHHGEHAGQNDEFIKSFANGSGNGNGELRVQS
jgi:cytoskeletal protein CcmA (bactofilin family)